MYWGDNYDLVQISEEAYKKKGNYLRVEYLENRFQREDVLDKHFLCKSHYSCNRNTSMFIFLFSVQKEEQQSEIRVCTTRGA